MTSSGTRSYNPPASDLVLTAFSKGCGLSAIKLTTEHMRTAAEEANLLNAQWGNEGVCLWESKLVPTNGTPLVVGGNQIPMDPATIAILAVFLRQGNNPGSNFPADPDAKDLYLSPSSTTEWAMITNKGYRSRPTTYWWDRQISPNLNLWPVPEVSGKYTLYAQVLLQIQDTVLPSGVTLDVPQRFFDAWVDGMSTRLSRHYATDRFQLNTLCEQKSWNQAVKRGGEDVMMNIQPALYSYYRM